MYMENMIRTQIYLDPALHNRMKQEARAASVSMAEYIRTQLNSSPAHELSDAEIDAQYQEFEDAMKELQFSGGPTDLASNFNEYLVQAIENKGR